MAVRHDNGRSFPLGATPGPDGVNFAVYSKNATAVELLLFDSTEAPKAASTIPFCPRKNRTFHYWHTLVPGLSPGQVYGYRVDGPRDRLAGHVFDREKLLLDPYGKAVAVGDNYLRAAAQRPGDNSCNAMRSVVVESGLYDWEGDRPLRRPFSQTVVYEMHVGGFTKHPNSGLPRGLRGTYAGLVEKIPYLVDLGITAVELLPVFQFDEQEAPAGLVNYWGYNPVSFFAPHSGYGSLKNPLSVLDEFRDMVKALHRAGIELILDVVYNHTAEGDASGPTFCFKGLANQVYYILGGRKTEYANYSGTGNTLNANHSIVRRLILDSLRYWVQEMHVDGFRFDLAAILSRDETGRPLANPPVLWDIETDPCLAGTKLIAEAWDAAGLYQVGTFIGDRWKEWNGLFRDDVRSFLKGDRGTVPKVAARFLASPDLYGHKETEPEQSINFVTCHDGFTLNDLVSYNRKHNEANLEENRDGHDQNLSWNCGAEGPSTDPEIEKLRKRQIKNFLSMTLLALGVPTLLMGDEVRRTQRGNNNAYCQDNEISWFDWSLLETHADIRRFVRRLVQMRLKLDIGRLDHDLTLSELLSSARIQWHGVKLNRPDWTEDSHSLAFTIASLSSRWNFHIMINAFWEDLDFELPVSPAPWERVLDTGLESPMDICDWRPTPIQDSNYTVQSRTLVVLTAEKTQT